MASTTIMRSPSEPDTSPLLRVDSPLAISTVSSTDFPTVSPATSTTTARSSPEFASKTRQPARKRQASKPASHSSSLRFFVVDHPTQLKDKKQLKENRKHVMQDYLDKERRNPSSTDARVTGSATGRKRKRLEAQLPRTSPNPASPAVIFEAQHSQTSQGQRSESTQTTPLLSRTATETIAQGGDRTLAKVNTASRRPIVFADDLSPLVHASSGSSGYLSTALDTVPDPMSPIGSSLNPFDTWPRPSNPLLNVEQLKWKCSRNFGTQGIATHWIPTLLKAKHAFLSTLCISASHEDIMQRGAQQPHERLPFGSSERWAVRGEVMSMINSAMKDPELRATDATIVAVLHLLNSEIMGCDGAGMAIHQRGLHNMIKERGGLKQLGVDGQLSSILTITMYLISTLRETEPHSDFVRYTEEKDTRPPSDERKIPESPVYCRPSGYITTRRALPSGSPMLELLDDLRSLTNAFIKETTTSLSNLPGTKSQESTNIQHLHQKLSTTKPAHLRPQDFSETRDKDRFEALRLVAQVYSHALSHRIPLSKAASHLSSSTTSWHIRIKQILVRTDLSECWGHLAGVLFWITLVSGACANPDSPANTMRRETSSEEEEARKWLAAVAVRCSIVLSFEYGGAILQTLKVMVGIEQALARLEAEREGREVQKILIGGVPPPMEEASWFGPAERPLPQRTFQDFARDFLEGS